MRIYTYTGLKTVIYSSNNMVCIRSLFHKYETYMLVATLRMDEAGDRVRLKLGKLFKKLVADGYFDRLNEPRTS